MKIVVIGAGIAGLSFAINRKRLYPNDDIVVLEHLDKPLKKVLVTGNGKCNIANSSNRIFNEEKIAEDILKEFDYKKQKEFLDSLCIKTKLVNDLSYPISESAVTVRNLYLKEIEKLGIKILTNTAIKDYKINKNIEVLSENGPLFADKLVFAVGGKSTPKLGSDGSILSLLKSYHYSIKEFNPALCPIYTKEKTKVIEGTRVKVNVKLYKNNEEIFNEDGELLFKEKGLSGIVIFNASRLIAKDINNNYVFKIDLLPSITVDELKDYLKHHNDIDLLESYLHPNIVKYINEKKNKDVIKEIKSLTFTFDKLYGFENSQISVGGIPFNEINESLESNREKNVYFIGEILNYDAPCGGYNLMWAIGTGLYLSKKIEQK